MSFNQKLARLGQDILDALDQHKLAYVVSYDATNELQVSVDDGKGFPILLRLIKAPQLANNIANPITGLTADVFTPHIIQVMPSMPLQAYTDIDFTANPTGWDNSRGSVLLAGVVAGDAFTIGLDTYTARAAPTLAGEFLLGATDAESAANLAAYIPTLTSAYYASVNAVTPEQVDLVMYSPGVAGDATAITDGGSGHYVPSGATFAGGVDGDYFDVNGLQFNCLASTGIADTINPWFKRGSSRTATTANAKLLFNQVEQDLNLSTGEFFATAAVPPSSHVIRIVSVSGGVGGNAYTVADAGMDISTANGPFAGGVDGATDYTVLQKVLSECFTRGPQTDLYKPTSTVDQVALFADFVSGNLLWSYRNLSWGNLSHM
jgi:hypothetical protein